MAVVDTNPFRFSGPLDPGEMIDREVEAGELLSLAQGGHSVRLVGPRRYGKTTLLKKVLDDAESAGMATALVDLEDVLSLSGIVVRIERAYARRLQGSLRTRVERLLSTWNVGLSLGGPGFSATLQRNPNTNVEAVLLRLLDLPRELHERTGTRSLIVFDEIQDILAVEGADGQIRSVIQHHLDAASYAFAGSAPATMERLFADPRRPLLEQAVPKSLPPLPAEEVGDYVREHFERTDRDAGDALAALLQFARGHPQRAMMLAHFLWAAVPHGKVADETHWVMARETTLEHASGYLAATWRGWPVNERRVALALATTPGGPYTAQAQAEVGINKSSVRYALHALTDRADVVEIEGTPVLTDPLLELWLQRHGA
ncbi:MAG TPA: hypothetical protein VGY30_09400 [Solirubrobacteraceae bacterium]|jgi:hypothetical protein|nr:hypothetical protein [Solirubrobacteraceae bacterium]